MAFLKLSMLLALLCSCTCLELRNDRPHSLGHKKQHGPAKNGPAKHGKKKQSLCWKSHPVSRHLTKQHRHMASLLGTDEGNWSTINSFGLNESAIVPFETVVKDGYLLVDCVQDKMMTTADKHGDGKWSYKNTAKVSIIFYDRIITDPEERKPMTPQVCYEFCRTIPDAGFFGLAAGRKCYCTPYFEMEASDSSSCDAVCEGEPTSFCGGMKKQSMYAMHMCADAAQDVTAAAGVGRAAKRLCSAVNTSLAAEIQTLQTLGDEIKGRAGKNGDPTTANYGQLAVNQVGKLNNAQASADALTSDLAGLLSDLSQFTGPGVNLYDSDTITDAETTNSETKALAEKATDMCSPYNYLTQPLANDTNNIKAYYPITYWTEPSENRAAATHIDTAPQSSCKGTPAGGSRIVTSLDECANLCDTMVIPGASRCIAFQYYKSSRGAVCTPLNGVDGITYYTKGICAPLPASAQTQGPDLVPQEIKCAARFSQMKGFDARVNSKDASIKAVVTKVLKRCA